jgi:uncharacterized protein
MNKLLILLLFFSHLSIAQLPARKAIMGIQGREPQTGFLVDSIFSNTTAANANLQKGDVITSVNKHPINGSKDYFSAVTDIRAGDLVQIEYSRKGKHQSKQVKATMKPFETSPIAELNYDWVNFRNGKLRVITRRPNGKSSVPAILLISGYNCGSIENFSKNYNGPLMNEWIKAGFAVVTIEKSGVGDSQGCKPCSEVDLATDIESFDAGYRYMEQLPYVDKTKLFIWGHSMGGSIAPEVAKRHTPRGVIVYASVFRPWSEFLLEMHRVQKPLLENLSYQQTENFLREINKIYFELLVLKKSPAQLHEMTEYKTLVESELGYKKGSNDMWGRHFKFWQQLDSINLAESWKQVNCPVLVLHGGADYEQCSALEPALIEKTINEAHPNMAIAITIPDIDHFMMKSADWKEAVTNFKEQQYLKGNFNYRITEETVKWLRNNCK